MHGRSEGSGEVSAVVVTYNPPPGLSTRLQATLQQVDRIVVCDNGSNQPLSLDDLADSLRARIHVIALKTNRGIATALNAGIAHACAQGTRHVLLLDHDSHPGHGMVKALLSKPDTPGDAAIRVPAIRYGHPEIRCRWPQARNRWRFRFVYADQMSTPQPVDLAIGSGMLLDASVWQRHGGFDEELFIDLVDTDYCLYLRSLGYTVVAMPQAELKHSLGEVEQRKLLGVKTYPTHHSALRHYYINRNRIVLSRRYGGRYPAWLAYEWLGAAKLAIKALCFEPQRLHKLAQMLRGTLHGLARSGMHARRSGV